MGITYGDHLIDSGYYDITPEQEREIEERKGTEMTEIVDLEYYEGLLAEVVRERENYNAMHQAACLEIDRLQEAKRRALKDSDRLAKENNALRQRLAVLANSEALASVRGIVAGWNGEGRAAIPFTRHPDNLGAQLPKTRCKAIYDLDDAIERAKALLTSVEVKQP